MRNSSILSFFLSNEDSLIRKIVINLYRSNSIVFQSTFNYMFLEISIISKHLSIIFKPWRLYSRNIVIFRCFSLFHEGKIVDWVAHLIDQMLIDILFEELPFLLLRSINEIKLLCFVEVLFIGIMEDMARKEWHLLWNVCLHLLSYIFILLTHNK